MTIWETDLEHGDKTIQLAEPIIKELFPLVQKIVRIDKGNQLDKTSMDIIVSFNDRDEIWAVKGRRPTHYHYKDITIEHTNGDGTRGDYFRFKGGTIQRYVYAKRTNGHIGKLFILNVAKMVLLFPYFENKLIKNQKHGGSSFFTIPEQELRQLGAIEKEWGSDICLS